MSLLTISAGLPDLDGIIRDLESASRSGSRNLQYTKAAVQDALGVIQRTWIQYASGTTVSYSGGTFRIRSVTGEYVRSIAEGLRMDGDFAGEVSTTSKHGAIIESGQNPHDMKPGLLASPRAKIDKKGNRYIIVPFRHGTPGSVGLAPMPTEVYSAVRTMAYSRRKGNLMSGGKEYTWGGRYNQKGVARAGQYGNRSHVGNHPGAGYTLRSGIYEGMVRMGDQHHSQYLTFRRVSEKSDPRSWRHPGTPPRPIRQAVVENTRDEILGLIRQGFEVDLYFMGLGGNEQ